jgi:hypothetical protein
MKAEECEPAALAKFCAVCQLTELSPLLVLERISLISSVLAGCDRIVLRRTPATNPRIRLLRSPCPTCLADAIDATTIRNTL